MPKSKYLKIYQVIKQRIETFEYDFQQLLPSENKFAEEFSCSRNTVRRALSTLASDGYVQSIHGKGVRVIFEPQNKQHFIIGSIESFTEAAKRNHLDIVTKVILFSELTVDERIRRRTGFEVGKEIYYIQRVRYINGKPLITDHNYFLKDIVTNLTQEIAQYSIYEYLENVLNVSIVTTKRIFTVEKIIEKDEQYMELNGCNCVAVVSNSTYNADGVMFEFTQSRHSPMYFEFHDVATRNRPAG